MHEHIARTLYYFQVQLLYASIVALAAWALTSIRGGSATAKYWIWVATSLNFVLPVGSVIDKLFASHLGWASPLGIFGEFANRISRGPFAVALALVWLVGAMTMFARLCLRIRAERHGQVTRGPRGLDLPARFLVRGIPVRFEREGQAPAVHGVLNPYISLPNGIDRVLSEDELNAVIIHELTHARRRDNLIRLLHEMTVCALWFHPVAWIAGSRLALYRELSCDESVVRSAHGGELISALAKLANPEEPLLLEATAASFLSYRLARLESQPQPARPAVSVLLIVLFGAVLLWGIVGTVAHTACCFLART
jgi:beta-lactamase regulating signal transducer with metallopeptidase domain